MREIEGIENKGKKAGQRRMMKEMTKSEALDGYNRAQRSV